MRGDRGGLNGVGADAHALKIMPITFKALSIMRQVDTRTDEAERSIELASGRLQKKWIPHGMELLFGSDDRLERLESASASTCSSYLKGIRLMVIQRSNLGRFDSAVRVD